MRVYSRACCIALRSIAGAELAFVGAAGALAVPAATGLEAVGTAALSPPPPPPKRPPNRLLLSVQGGMGWMNADEGPETSRARSNATAVYACRHLFLRSGLVMLVAVKALVRHDAVKSSGSRRLSGSSNLLITPPPPETRSR